MQTTSNQPHTEDNDYFQALLHSRNELVSMGSSLDPPDLITSKRNCMVLASCIDSTNNHIYFILGDGRFIVYDYQSHRVVKEFTLCLVLVNRSLKACKKVNERGHLYFIVTSYGFDPVFYKYNVYVDELTIIDKTHDVMNYFYMDMIQHNDSVYYYGNQFKSDTSYLVEYKARENSLNTIRTFTDNGSFNYQYPDPNLMTICNDKCFAIGTTSFSYQAFSNGTMDRDLWIFSQHECKRIRTTNCQYFSTDVEPYATCYVPYGNNIAGIIFGGFDEGNEVVVDKVGFLVIPLDELENLEQLEWKLFEIPSQILEKINSSCSLHLLEHIPEKYYKFLITKMYEVYELEIILEKGLIYNSAKYLPTIHNKNSLSDVEFNFKD